MGVVKHFTVITMKALVSITAAIAAAAATAAHAGHTITVDETQVSPEAKASIVQLSKNTLAAQDDSKMIVLSAAMNTAEAGFEEELKVVLTQSYDSTGVNRYDPLSHSNAGGCYSNCYNNCHGSRSWR